MKIQVIEDCYYVSDGRVMEDEYLSKEELFNSITHLLVKGDVWETDKENPEYFVCVESENWLGELNDGWWSYEELKHFFKEI